MRVHAVLVTYNCDEEVRERLRAPLEEVERLWVYDNSSAPLARAIVAEEAALAKGRIVLHSTGENVGLARAQNWGLKQALREGADAVLLLDQDSLFTEGALRAYLDLVENQERVAAAPQVYCPNVIDAHTGQRATFVFRGTLRPRFAPLSAPLEPGLLLCMASGMVLPAAVLRQVGWMNPNFFIDGLDTEYCLRVLEKGGRVVGMRDAVLVHQLGRREVRRFLFWKVNITRHSALRLFTIFRNRILILAQLPLLRADYLVYDLMVSLFIVFKVLFLERGRTAKAVAILRGSFAGCFGPRGWP